MTDMSPVTVACPVCMMCGQGSMVEMPMEAYLRWASGEHIQNVLPEMSAARREQLLTGTHDECWDAMFCSHDKFCEVHEEGKCPSGNQGTADTVV